MKYHEGGEPASMASDDLDPLAFTQVGAPGLLVGAAGQRPTA